jgi:hypothetical protein
LGAASRAGVEGWHRRLVTSTAAAIPTLQGEEAADTTAGVERKVAEETSAEERWPPSSRWPASKGRAARSWGEVPAFREIEEQRAGLGRGE